MASTPKQRGTKEDPLAKAFDADAFRRLGHRVVDQLADYLERVPEGGDMPVLTWEDPDAAAEAWRASLVAGSVSESEDGIPDQVFFDEVLKHCFHGHHPRNLGHQVGPVLPLSAIVEMMASLLDTGNGVYEVGGPATPMERAVLQELAARLGMPGGADGILTSGGSLGNLTAMLAMRQCQSDVWDKGSAGGRTAVLVSEEAHYSIDRAVKIMGLGEDGCVSVPVDDQFQMSVESLEKVYRESITAGYQVMGVVASAGSTGTGRIDPLPELADFCTSHALWLHVDAAHAGAFVYSKAAAPMLEGLERADSVVIDFHKMMLSPSLLTAVLFKRGKDSYRAFAQKADYLWQANETEEWWDGAKRTVECTRPMLGLRAYALLRFGGEGLLSAYIDRALEATRQFAALLEGAEDFEILIQPQSNILCYRYVPPGMDEETQEVDALNRRIRAALVRRGRFYIVQIEKAGRLYLRSAVMNPFVTVGDFEALLDEIRMLAK